jgi:hypothetical protein
MDYSTQKARAAVKIIIADLQDIAAKLSILRESVEHCGDAISGDYKRSQERKGKQECELITVKFTDKEIQSSETAQREQNAIQESIRNATRGAVVVAAIYAALTYCMFIALQKQTRIQREASINTERAWIGLDEPVTIDVLETVPQLKVEAHYSIKNFGHGPAFKVVPQGWFEIDSKLLPAMAKSECEGALQFATGTVRVAPSVKNPGPMGYVLFPGQPHKETIGSPTDPFQGDGQPNLKHFWFVGCVAYSDQFGTAHWTRFCMEPDFRAQPMSKDTPLQPCALYNDTDDGEVQKD